MSPNNVYISIAWLDAYRYTARQSTIIYYKSLEATS